MTDLKDRTALVTGSTSGIGKATALALAARGARVLVVGRHEQRAEQVVAEIEGNGGTAEFDETFAVNVKIPFFLVASLAPAMAERGWGSIVNLSTMVASFGQPGMAMYGASRAALELLTKAWAPNTADVASGSTPLPPARRAPG